MYTPSRPIIIYRNAIQETLYYTTIFGSDSVLIKCQSVRCDNSVSMFVKDEMVSSNLRPVVIPSSFAITKDIFIYNSYFPRRDDIIHFALFSVKNNIAFPIYSLDGPIWNGSPAMNSSIFPTAVSLLKHLDGRKELFFNDFNKIRSVSMSDRTISVVKVGNKCTNYSVTLPSLYNLGSYVNPVDKSVTIYAASYPDSNAQTYTIKKEAEGSNTWCPLTSDIENIPVPNESHLNQSIFNDPSGIVLFKGEIYISDTKSNRIRKITSDSRVVTLAGGGYQQESNISATETFLNAPFGIAIDNSTEDIYFSDSNNHCIKKISKETGFLEYFAGTCGKQGIFNFPKSISLIDDFMFVADSMNHRIARINMKTMLIETIVGDGIAGEEEHDGRVRLNTPMGVHYFEMCLFVADTNNHRILKVYNALAEYPTHASLDVIASNDDVKLAYPYGVHAFRIGFKLLYIICNTFNNRLIVVQESPSRFFTEIGSGLPGYNGDLNIFEASFFNPKGAFTNDGQTFYFTDSSNNLIRKLETSTGMITTIAGGNGDGGSVLNTKIKVTSFSPTQNGVVVTDVQNNLIRLISNDGIVTSLVGSGGTLYNGEGLEPKLTNLNAPYSVVVHKDEIYFADAKNMRLRKLTKKGTVSTILVDVAYPLSLRVKENGDIIYLTQAGVKIYYAKTGNVKTIQKYLFQKISMDYDPDDGSIYYPTDTAIIRMTPNCQSGYVLNEFFSECIPVCFNQSIVDGKVCSGNGECIETNTCKCTEHFSGMNCENPKCFGFDNLNEKVCNSKGTCISVDQCECINGYTGVDCTIPLCFGMSGNISCGGHECGRCVSHDVCLCNYPHYSGRMCELANCNGIPENDPDVCSGNGFCKAPDECVCEGDFYGKYCSKYDNSYISIGVGIGVSAGLIVLLLIVGIVLVCVLRIYKKQKKIIDTDLGLDRQLLSMEDMDQGGYTNHSTKSTNSVEEDFFIPLAQLNIDKPIKRLGTGGMGSVFMTKWNNIIIAVKVFDLNNENIGIEDFSNEAILLSRVRHPNIISFFGVSASPTKRYIAMKCMDSSLETYIQKMQFQQFTLSLRTKLKMISDICRGINYLHNLQPNFIVHRDLKPANILIDKDGNCKVCDFGLGRVLSKQTLSNITSRIGTCNYMAPEISGFSGKEIDRSYVKAIDIYSLSIIIYQVLFEVIDPYSCQDLRIVKKIGLSEPTHYESFYHLHRCICEFKVRPSIPFNDFESCVNWCKEYDSEENAEIYWTLCEKVIKESWKDEASERPSIGQLVEIVDSL